MSSWCEGAFTIYIGRRVDLYTRLLPRVLPSVYAAKASHAQLPDSLSEASKQALRLIASIPIIQRREKCHSREEKSAFP